LSENILKWLTETASTSTINAMNNNALQIKTFDPSVLIGKVIYELDSNNIITLAIIHERHLVVFWSRRLGRYRSYTKSSHS